MGMLWRDIHYGMRMLRKNPGFAIIAVLTLALGIGANVTIFSLVDVVLFRPLPITKPSAVVRLTTGRTRGEAFGGFVGVSFENLPEIWIPMAYGFQIDPLLKSQIPLRRESFAPFAVVARLKPGVSITQAQAQLDTLGAGLGAGRADPSEGTGFVRPWPVLCSGTEEARHDRIRYSFLLLSIVALVLLIACADAGGLFLARAQARQKEIAVRLALGATRFRIIRLHVIEGLLVSVLGALTGGFVANWGVLLISASAPATLPIPLERASSILDFRILGFAAFVAICVGILSNLVPAFRYSRSDLIYVMKEKSRTFQSLTPRLSLPNLLGAIQVAASLVLLIV